APTTDGQSLADDFFRAPEAVDRRRIDQIDSALERRVDRADGIVLVAAAPHPAADRPSSERNARDSHRGAGNIDEFHVGLIGSNTIHHSTPGLGGDLWRRWRS